MPQSKSEYAANGFAYIVAATLVLVSAAKVFSLLGHSRILDESDPLLRITTRHLLLAAAIVECSVACLLVTNWTLRFKLLVIIWLSSTFVLYRFGLIALHSPKPCPCLGSAVDSLGISQHTANMVLMTIIAFMSCGGLYFLWNTRRHGPEV